MSSKEERVTAARQTLQAFHDGYYETETTRVDLEELHEKSLNHITLYTPEMTDKIYINASDSQVAPTYRLSQLPVVSELVRTKRAGGRNIGILNFASAKNPGGGFLNGAAAQEESLAMCGNLYLTQIKKQAYYEANRACRSMLYTDHMIYSGGVVFIRENTDPLWESPLTASVLTVPAVNMGQYLLKREGDSVHHAEEVMKNRMRKILNVFAEQKNEVLILGAYGCGVFRNDPVKIAAFFVELLKSEGLEKHFKELIFAVYDSSKDKRVYNAFSNELLPLCCHSGVMS